jgi:catechol 2,3-dioxygenase-like lactoylglutathione lyase family enzyme
MSGTTVPLPGRISAAHPILPAQDLDITEAFYRQLGFSAQGRWGGYMILRREGVELHFWECWDRRIAEQSSCYLRTPDVDALHKAFGTPVGGKVTPPEDRPWGMREFFVMDPNGNLLRVGQLIG